MDTKGKKAFRKAFMGGFSKKDVNRYIEETSTKYSSEIDELKSLLSDEQAKNAALTEKLSAAETALSEKDSELSALTTVRDELTSLKARYDELASQLAGKEEEAHRLAEENSALSERVSSLSRTESEYTARKAELAEIEISARSRASELLSDTEREIESRRIAYDTELSERERRFAEERARTLASAQGAVEQLTRLASSLHGEVESMDARLVRIADSARNNVAMLLNAVSDAETKISDIGEAMSSLDNK